MPAARTTAAAELYTCQRKWLWSQFTARCWVNYWVSIISRVVNEPTGEWGRAAFWNALRPQETPTWLPDSALRHLTALRFAWLQHWPWVMSNPYVQTQWLKCIPPPHCFNFTSRGRNAHGCYFWLSSKFSFFLFKHPQQLWWLSWNRPVII